MGSFRRERGGRGERPPTPRWPLVTVLIVLVVVVAGALVVVATNDHKTSVASATEVTFTGRVPPVVVAATGATTPFTVTSTDGSSSGSSTATTAASSVSSASGSSASSASPSSATAPTDATTPATTLLTTTTTAATTTTTTAPQCFVPAQISITFPDGSAAKVTTSGDGVSGRTFVFQFPGQFTSADATIDGLVECGQHYQMMFSAKGGSGFVCGPPPTLSGSFRTSIPGDSASITVAPQGATC